MIDSVHPPGTPNASSFRRPGAWMTGACVALMAVGLFGALRLVALRRPAERANRNVEISVDYDEVSALAASMGAPPRAVLARFRDAGARSVSIHVPMIEELALAGQVVRAGDTTISAWQGVRLADALRDYSPELSSQVTTADDPVRKGWKIVTLPAAFDLDSLRDVPLGIPAAAAAEARAAGLDLVARMTAPTGAGSRGTRAILRRLRDAGAHIVVFRETDVLGYRGREGTTAEALREAGLCFGRIEFAKQNGEAQLSTQARDLLVSVHSATTVDLATLDPYSAVVRFRKAARERANRLLYTRLFYGRSPDALEANLAYVKRIARSVHKDGFTLGPATPLGPVPTSRAARFAVGLGVGAAAWLLVLMVVSLPASVAYFGCLALPAGLGLGAALGGLPAQLVALVCSVVYPVLGILWPSRRIRVASPLVAALTGVAAVALVSAIGGACIYGLLTSRETMLRLEIFRGIKVALLGPVVLVAAAGLTGLLWERTPWADARREVVRRIGSLLGSSITVWQLGLGLGLLVMLAIMVIRGGSEVAGAASGFEIRFRAALDNLMFVRPRTKECFVGHPLLMLGFYLLARGRRTAAAVCLTAGSIGAISVLNSFCHIHSPFDLAVVRTVVGYVVGAAIGLVACGVARLASVRAQQPAGQ